MQRMNTVAAALLAGCLVLAWPVSLGAAELAGHARQIETLLFSPDGKRLVSGGHDGRIVVWDTETGKPAKPGASHRLLVSGLAFSEDGSKLVSSSWDGTAVVWTRRGKSTVFQGHEDLLNDVAITADGKRLATSSNDKTIRLWDVDTGRQLGKHQFVDPVPDALAFSPNGKTLAVGTRRRTVVLMDVDRWEPRATLDVGGTPRDLRFVAAGRHLLVGVRGVARWDVITNQRVLTYKAKGRARGEFGADASGRVIAALSNRGLTVWRKSQADASELLVAARGKDGTAVAVSPDGKRIAVGYITGELAIYDAETGKAAQRMAAHARPAAPPAVRAMFGKDLLSPARRRHWRKQTPTDALRWTKGEGEQDHGLAFVAASIPTHMAGHDTMTAATGLGNGAFDLTFDVRLDQAGGSQYFTAGLAVGVSSSVVDQMGEEDIAATAVVHLDGVFLGVTQGEPYRMHPRYYKVSANAIARAGRHGRKDVVPWTRAARGTFTRDLPIRIRIRRTVAPAPAKDPAEPRHRLAFTMWVPSAGQSEDLPWQHWTWIMPEDLRDKPLDHLFIKRVNVTADHLGAQGIGYGDMLRLKGRLANMRLHPDPPTIGRIDYASAVLAPGDTVDVRGAGFTEDVKVTVGGKPAGQVQRVSAGHLRVTVGELAAGRNYGMTVRQPTSGLTDTVDGGVPIGRLLVGASLIEAAPTGGEMVTITGYGLDKQTTVRFGDRPGQVIKAIGERGRELMVKIPAGPAGAAPITAGHPKAKVHGIIPFGRAARPSVWFTAEELAALRRRSNREPWNAYRRQLLKLAGSSVKARPGRAHGRVNSAAPVFWGYLLTGEDVYRKRMIEWMRFFVMDRKFGEWYYRDAKLTALGYDLVADELDPAFRAPVQEYLLAALDHYVEHDMPGSWFADNPTSNNPMVNSAAVVLALMFDHARHDADRILAEAKRNAARYIDVAFSPDGAWTEGMSWAAAGLADYFELARLLAQHRDDRTLLGRKRLARATRMYELMTVSQDELITYNNMHHGMKGAAPAAHLDARTDTPLLRWVADAAVAHVGPGNAHELGLAMMWRSDKPAPDTEPDLPVLARLDDVNWVTMRSHGRVNAPLLVGLKGMQNGPQPYHQQTDPASFTLYNAGEPLVLDPGWGQSRAEQHSIPLIDGRGPDRWGAAITDTLSHGPWRAAVVDATDAYHWSTGARRMRRTVVMHREGAVVVFDDIAPARDKPNKVRWNLQTPAAELAEGSLIKVVGRTVAMTARLFGPAVEISTRKQKRKYRKTQWYTVSADYTAAPERPLVTVIRVGQDTNAPEVNADVTYQPDRITVALGERGKLTFRQINAGWGLVKPGDEAGKLLLTPQPLTTKPRVVAVKADRPPTLDGKLDDAVWRSAKVADAFVPGDSWDADAKVRAPTEAKFAWDEQNLYLAIRAHEPDLAGVVSTLVGPAQSLMHDDHIQFFLDPGNEHAVNRYFGYHLPADGMHLGVYGKMGDIGSGELTIRASRETDEPTAWTLEIAIPWNELLDDPWRKLMVRRPTSGLEMSMNLRRYRMPPPKETSTWSRSEPNPAAVPWRWGTLVLE